MDLFRVQGRWGPSARLAWVRCVLKASTDVCGGSQLSKAAPNSFPPAEYFEQWASFMDGVFQQHVNNIICPEGHCATGMPNPKTGSPFLGAMYQYRIDSAGEKQFLRTLMAALDGDTSISSGKVDMVDSGYVGQGARYLRASLQITEWSESLLLSFLRTALRGFFRGDLYTAMTEFLSRAEGSFGLQVRHHPET